VVGDEFGGMIDSQAIAVPVKECANNGDVDDDLGAFVPEFLRDKLILFF
jgi:hypothetical protein